MLLAQVRSMLIRCTEVIQSAGQPQSPEEEEQNNEEYERGQEHVFSFYNELTDEEKRELDEVFDNLDVDDLQTAFQQATASKKTPIGVSIVPPKVMHWDRSKPPETRIGANLTRVHNVAERRLNLWRSSGLAMLRDGKIGVVIMSGGFDMPFGEEMPIPTTNIGLLSRKNIYQLYIERVRRLQHLVHRKYRESCPTPIYVMCNTVNRDVIEDFFYSHKFFGYKEEDVMFFTQFNLPTCDSTGGFLLADRHKIAMHPNGSGGIFEALLATGMVSDMKSRGVASLYVCGDRNVVAKVGDPLFLGFSAERQVDICLKSVEKLNPEEDLGVFCMKEQEVLEDEDGDGKLDTTKKVKAMVLESRDVPDETARRKNKTHTGGEPALYLSSGNLSEYFIRLEFIGKAAAASHKHWHVRQMSVPYLDPDTEEFVEPEEWELNGYLLEHHFCDALEITKVVTCLEVPRTEMALVKHVAGAYTPATAVQALGFLHQQWIRAAGGTFDRGLVAGDYENEQCEISPLVSFEGEDLKGQFPPNIILPFYLPSFQETQMDRHAEMPEVLYRMRNADGLHYLERDTHVAARLLSGELGARLQAARKVVEDPSIRDYPGEFIGLEHAEALPPTPRAAEVFNKKASKSFSPNASPRSGEGFRASPRRVMHSHSQSPRTSGSSPSSEPSPRSPPRTPSPR